MYQIIGEPIKVAGIFEHGRFTPKKFQWQTRVYPVQKITLVSDVKDGGVKKRLVSVLSGREVFRLEFNRDSEEWFLAEMWVE